MGDEQPRSDRDQWLALAVDELSRALESVRALTDEADAAIAAALAALASARPAQTGATPQAGERAMPTAGPQPPQRPEPAAPAAEAAPPPAAPERVVETPPPGRAAPAATPVPATSPVSDSATVRRRRRQAVIAATAALAAVVLALVAIGLVTRSPSGGGGKRPLQHSPGFTVTMTAPPTSASAGPSASLSGTPSASSPATARSSAPPTASALPRTAQSPAPVSPGTVPPAAGPAAPAPGAAPPGVVRVASACTGTGWQARRLAAALSVLSYPYSRLGIRIVAAPAREGVLATGRISTRVVTAYVRSCTSESVGLLAAAVADQVGQLIDRILLTNMSRLQWMLARGAPPGTAWIPDGLLDFASVFTLWQVGEGYWRSELPPPSAEQLEFLKQWYTPR